ncbi:MAG TPA: OmpA family protein [Geobacteraceae bacterium]|nr:OmpA family protein [Geobacteraceae bacterium]
MKKLFVGTFFLLAALMTTTCLAGERKGAFSISPFGGGYTFDGIQHQETAPVYGVRLGYDLTNNWGEEWVVDFSSTDGTRDERSVNTLLYRFDLLYNFLAKGPVVPYLALGGGGITAGHGGGFNAGGSNTSAIMDGGGGVKYFVTDSIALRADARQIVVFDQRTKFNWEYTGGLTFLIGGNKPEPVPVAAPSCNLSASPTTITRGQSATLSWTSQNATKCSIKPGIGTVDPQGSTTVTPSESTTYDLVCSGEGGEAESGAAVTVAAPQPSAPSATLTINPSSIRKGEKAAMSWTSQNATECMIQPDIGTVKPGGDMEITPAADTAYTLTCTGAGGKATSDAKVTVAVPTKEDLCMTLNIEYDTDKAVIKPAYYGEVEKVADFMKRFPQIKGTIEGHTDNVASAQYNIKLSQRRADGVVKMLVEKYGIDKSRLTAKGYGLTKPIADNGTKEGRQKNRRTVANFGCVTIEK